MGFPALSQNGILLPPWPDHAGVFPEEPSPREADEIAAIADANDEQGGSDDDSDSESSSDARLAAKRVLKGCIRFARRPRH